MKTYIHKLSLAVSMITLSLCAQSAWACDKPETQGVNYQAVGCLQDGLVLVKQNGKYGYIDKTGKVVKPFE